MNSKELLSLSSLFLKKSKKKKKRKITKDYAETMMKGEKHPHKECVKKMKKHVDTPEAFCAKVKDVYKGTKKWRGKDRSK